LPTTFSGRVVDAAGKPIDGATVHHVPRSATRKALGLLSPAFGGDIPWDDLPSTTTDSSGRFALSGVELPLAPDHDRVDPRSGQSSPNRVPQLVARHPDYAVRAWECEGYEHGDFDAGDIMLRAGASLVGRMVDEDGRPLAGVTFSMSMFGGPWNVRGYGSWRTIRSALGTISGRDGSFELRELWSDRMTFVARLEGHAPTDVEARLTEGEVEDVGDVVMRKGSVIRGHVVSTDGQPIEGAEVLARAAMFRHGPAGGDTVLMELRMSVRGNDIEDVRIETDADGAFGFSELHLDSYSIFAGADGHDPVVQRDVPLGDTRVLLELPRQATVLVTVVDKTTDERVSGVTGLARRMASKTITQMEPLLDVLEEGDVLDVVEADEIEAGTHGLLLVQGAGSFRTHLVVSAPGYATDGFVLKGVPPGERALRTVKLVPESSVSGRVIGANDEPLPGAKVTLEPPEALRVKQAKREILAGEDGRFRFGDLRAGDWQLSAEAEGHVESDPRTVTVVAETAHADEDVQLSAGATIRGVVIDADGAPAANYQISARRLDVPQQAGEVGVTVTSKDGTLTFKNPPSVGADHEGRFVFDGIAPGRYELKAFPGAEQVLFVGAGEVAHAELLLRRPPVVTGRVTDANGPVTGAQVGVWESEPWGSWDRYGESAVTTDEFGEYELTLWKPGTVQVAARHEKAITPPVDVTADWGMNVTADLAFARGSVTGRVTDQATGDPIQGARVNLTLMDRQPDGTWKHAEPRIEFGTVSTDADGRYVIGRVMPGHYRFDVRATGYLAHGDTGVEVHATGGPDDLEVVLEQGATISGHVYTADGSPLPGSLRVKVGDEDGHGSFAWCSVEADGSYKAVGLKRGSYVVRLESSAINLMGPSSNKVLATAPVTVGDAQTVVKDLVIEP
jgi:protocatechuate 3,4-dioxygenase beta subunit